MATIQSLVCSDEHAMGADVGGELRDGDRRVWVHDLCFDGRAIDVVL